MYESVREFASEACDPTELERSGDRHADYFLAAAQVWADDVDWA